ncbi:hypothetical protein GUJ93_ZPchr0010g10633 [Zizania palustris]|uniref:Uncharacterized protein n=1 Tax=Zizania palustris TaxID=103762 RepID=A0A8J5W955_ZIZPA|nr:hypothetical protein GUJ93_ZPchr0010g10633 [Zizania palustris]
MPTKPSVVGSTRQRSVARSLCVAFFVDLMGSIYLEVVSSVAGSYDADCDGKLKHQFDASAAVNTIATGAGLIGTFVGYSSNFTPDRHVTVSESLLFLTIVGRQFVMVVTTARPAFRNAALSRRRRLLGGLALLGFSLDFFELVIFFVATFCSETGSRSTSSEPCAPVTGNSSEADAPGAALEGKQLMWLAIMFVYFTALVALYQKQTGKKPQMFDKARILLYFTAFCCCSLHGGDGKLPLLPAMDLPRNHHWWLGLARSSVMGLAALDWILRLFLLA